MTCLKMFAFICEDCYLTNVNLENVNNKALVKAKEYQYKVIELKY